jgi:hypothetical protein
MKNRIFESFKNKIITDLNDSEYSLEFIDEKLITFGGKVYPKFNNVVILAGGGGSGKDFQMEQLFGIEGKVFDVDRLKILALSVPDIKDKIRHDMDIQQGKDIDLRNPDHTSMLHDIIKNKGLKEKSWVAFGKTLDTELGILSADPSRKPNLIFNVTLKDIETLYEIELYTRKLGYDKGDIHIVWVINDVEVARVQNKERDRRVHDLVLVQTHDGVALTMKEIINMGEELSQVMDGDIWFSYNKRGVDTKFERSKIEAAKPDEDSVVASFKKALIDPKTGEEYFERGGYMSKANYFQIKKKGKAPISADKLADVLFDKIIEFVPHNAQLAWEFERNKNKNN